MVAKYDDGNYEINESYRAIRTFIAVDESLKTILVTSAEMDEGKTTAVSNIARCFSELEDKRTLLVDCDFRKKGVNKQFGLEKESLGLTDIIYKGKDLDECIIKYDNLDVLTCGTVHCNPSVLLEMERTKNFIESLKEKYDYIFIDSPPVMRVNDACIISQYVDGTVIISASKETDKHQVKVTKERLEKVNAKIIGVVLNKFKSNVSKVYSYYSYGDYEDMKKSKFKFFKRRKIK